MTDMSALARTSLAGEALSRTDAFGVLQAPDTELRELLDAAFSVRSRTFGRKVKVCVLQNAQSGLCPEDCHYCSQSKISTASIQKYRLLPQDQLLAGARKAVAAGARRYCMVASGRGPQAREIAPYEPGSTGDQGRVSPA